LNLVTLVDVLNAILGAQSKIAAISYRRTGCGTTSLPKEVYRPRFEQYLAAVTCNLFLGSTRRAGSGQYQ